MRQLVAASGDSAEQEGDEGGDGERETCGDGSFQSRPLAMGEEDAGEGVRERRGEG